MDLPLWSTFFFWHLVHQRTLVLLDINTGTHVSVVHAASCSTCSASGDCSCFTNRLAVQINWRSVTKHEQAKGVALSGGKRTMLMHIRRTIPSVHYRDICPCRLTSVNIAMWLSWTCDDTWQGSCFMRSDCIKESLSLLFISTLV
jgi:hypothetical protein